MNEKLKDAAAMGEAADTLSAMRAIIASKDGEIATLTAECERLAEVRNAAVADDTPISMSTYGSKEACEAEHARRAASAPSVDRNAVLEEAARLADAEKAEFTEQAGRNNGRDSDFAFGSVNSGERIAAAIRALKYAAPVAQPLAPSGRSTDLSHRLRETADQHPGWKPLLTAAADEIERYYCGMMAWKKTAEAKDVPIPAARIPAPIRSLPDIDRYDWNGDYGMEPSPDGDYVKWEDVQSIAQPPAAGAMPNALAEDEKLWQLVVDYGQADSFSERVAKRQAIKSYIAQQEELAVTEAKSYIAAQPLAGQDAEPTDRDALIACLGDDAAKLREANPDDEMAQTMDEAAAMLAADEVNAAVTGMALAGQDVRAVTEATVEECWSSDQEDFNCTSLAELIDRAGNLKPGQTVWVGQPRRPEPRQIFDAEDALVQMGERAHEIAADYADNYPDVTDAQKDELQALIEGWISKYAAPTFWTVVNIKPYLLSHEDFPNDPAPIECAALAAPSPVNPKQEQK